MSRFVEIGHYNHLGITKDVCGVLGDNFGVLVDSKQGIYFSLDGEEVETICDNNRFTALSLSTCETYACLAERNSISLYHIPSKSMICTKQLKPTIVTMVEFIKDNEFVFIGTEHDKNYLWSVSSPENMMIPILGHSNVTSGAAFREDGNILATVSWDKRILLFKTDTQEVIAEIPKAHLNHMKSVAFTYDGYLLTGSNNSSLKKWDVRKPTESIFEIETPQTPIAIRPLYNNEIILPYLSIVYHFEIDEDNKNLKTLDTYRGNRCKVSRSGQTLLDESEIYTIYKTPAYQYGRRVKSAASVIQ